MARPKLPIDEEQVKKLAMIQCTNAEMAAVLKCSPDTLERRFAAIIKEGREIGRSSLKREMYKRAMQGNTTMLVWLSKNQLGYSDRAEINSNVDVSISVTKTLTVDELIQRNPFLDGTPDQPKRRALEIEDADSVPVERESDSKKSA